MTTLEEAPEQLQHWIDEIDAELDRLSLQRRAMAATLVALGVPSLGAGNSSTGVVVEARPPPPQPGPRLPNPAARDEQRSAKPKAAKKAAAATSSTGSKYDYAEVTRIANAAHRAGQPMGDAVAQRFSVSKAMGSFLIVEARKRGHDITKRAVATKPPANVTPIAKPASSAFTPDDSLKLLQGGIADG